MSLIQEFTKIIETSRKQCEIVEPMPLFFREEVKGNDNEWNNVVYHGDNARVMKTLIDQGNMAGKVKLIYIDPPFFSKANYEAVVKAGNEKIKHLAYEDKWEQGLSAYLKMLTVRLMLMRDLLAEDGVIWLHLDWHVVHYAKVLMDEIFGEKNLINEIIWTYKSGGSGKKHFSRKHDTILVYSKGAAYDFYPIKEKSYNRQFKPYRFKGVTEYQDDIGWYTMVNMKDVWTIDMVGRTAAERTGYATQKPQQLLERILECCSKEGDLCADFFCGSGTLPAVASKMGRKFIACDESGLAIESTINRLNRQKESFRVYDTEGKNKSKISAKITVVLEDIPGSTQKLFRLELCALTEKFLDKTVEEEEKLKLKKIMKDDSLQLVESWSVDFHYSGDVHRPEMIFMREQGQLITTCEKILTYHRDISVKVVDVLGNIFFERIEQKNG